jgi:hypothetical protein
MGESGTLATAASLAAVPDLIYAGGQNNGASSGVLKTIDGGIHWTRQSKGLWDTRVLAVWLHPDDPKGGARLRRNAHRHLREQGLRRELAACQRDHELGRRAVV